MLKCELREIKTDFTHYLEGFYINGALSAMQKLKHDHSLRVSENSLRIAEDLRWTEQDKNIAKAIGLLHDIARFQQWQDYATFSDRLSVDHGDLGAEILSTTLLLDKIDLETKDLIIHSVSFHNKKDIPQAISTRQQEHLQVIREADRLDIIHVILSAIESGKIYDHPEILWNADLTGMASQEVLADFCNPKGINYALLSTMSDWVLLHLQWICKLQFLGSKKLVLQRQYVERLQQVSPDQSQEINTCFHTTQASLQHV